jgi:hypothetical protein
MAKFLLVGSYGPEALAAATSQKTWQNHWV